MSEYINASLLSNLALTPMLLEVLLVAVSCLSLPHYATVRSGAQSSRSKSTIQTVMNVGSRPEADLKKL
jgi:hypothetical protein